MAPTDSPRTRKTAKPSGAERRSRRRPPDVGPPISMGAFIAAMNEKLPGLDFGHKFDEHPMPDVAEMREKLEVAFRALEAGLAEPRPTTSVSHDERILRSVLRQGLPKLRASADDFSRFAEAAANPDKEVKLLRVFTEWLLASPAARTIPQYIEFYLVIFRAGFGRARRLGETKGVFLRRRTLPSALAGCASPPSLGRRSR
jgi:hypothetical protein